MEEEQPSPTALVVSSPRRILSLFRDCRATISAPNSDASSANHEQRTNAEDDLFGTAGPGFAGAHGPKPSKVFGFVRSITTIMATGRIGLFDPIIFCVAAIFILNASMVMLYVKSVHSWQSQIMKAVYLLWAYTLEWWLHSVGITYYPSKYWALAVPTFVTVSVLLMMMLYLGLNFLVTR